MRGLPWTVCCSTLLLLLPSVASAATPQLLLPGVGDADSQALAALFAQAAPTCADTSVTVARLASTLAEELRTRARAGGRYAPVIARRFEPDADCWKLVVRMEPGPIAQVHNVVFTIDGGTDDDFTDLLSRQPRPGQPFIEADYERFKGQLAARAAALGYFDATFTAHTVHVYPAAGAVDIELAFSTGNRYHFGDVAFEPAEQPLSADFLAALVPFRKGDPYTAAGIAEFRERLVATGYFRSIDVAAALEELDADMAPIHVRLQSLPKRETTVGAGFATDTGPRLRGGYVDRFIGQRGRQFDALLAWSTVVAEATASLKVPSRRPARSFFAIDGGFRQEETDDTRSKSVSVGGREFTQLRSGWQRTAFADASYEAFRLGDDPEKRSLLIVPGVRFEGVDANDDQRFEQGHRLLGEVRATHTALLSSATFIQARFSANYSLLLGDKARVSVRGEVGGTWADGFAELPPTYRFFAGGDQSVRGFDFRALGPRDTDGNVIGGRYLAVASLEVERAMSARWSLATFADAGQAWSDAAPQVRVGAGIGVRYRTPIGSLRVDVAQPVDANSRRDGDGLRIHVGIGSLL